MENDNNLGGDCQQNLDDDAQQMGTIYKITNLVNSKVYVGQTRQKLEKRINQHINNSKMAKAGIDAAIRKYGWENFKVEVLEICPIDKLDEREVFWIAELDSMAPKNYNLTRGGNNNSNYSAEARARMSANHPDVSGEKNPNYGKHRKHSQATRNLISEALKGEKAPNYGKRFSQETRDKISANHADVSGEKNPNYGKHRKHSQATRDLISAANKGEKHHNYGKHHSQETRDKMSASQKAAWAAKKALAKDGDS